MLSILLASDRITVRKHFQKICGTSELLVCGEALSLEETLAKSALHSPDVVIFGFRCSVLRQTETILEMSRHSEQTKVLVCTSRDSYRSTQAFISAGAAALVPRQCTSAEFLKILSGATAGFSMVPIRSLQHAKVKIAYRTAESLAKVNLVEP